MPFHSTRKEEKETEVDISLLSYQSKPKVEEKRGKTVKLKQINAIPQTNAKIQLKNPSASVSYTSQTFRYCFACESTVLDANLRHHEK